MLCQVNYIPGLLLSLSIIFLEFPALSGVRAGFDFLWAAVERTTNWSFAGMSSEIQQDAIKEDRRFY